jgi:hypothetical protein
MASEKASLDLVSSVRLLGIIAFVLLSAMVYFTTIRGASVGVFLIGILFSYGALLGGIVLRRPDGEVLGWLILGTTLLAAEAESAAVTYWLTMSTAIAVVVLADIEHSVALLYPRSAREVVDRLQQSARGRLLRRRASVLGGAGGGALALSLAGVNLSPPLSLSGASATIVGILAVIAMLLVALVVLGGGQRNRSRFSARSDTPGSEAGSPQVPP